MRPDGVQQSFGEAVANAIKGISVATKQQRNVKIDLCIAVLAVVLGFVFRISAGEWLAVVVCVALVVAMETVNTAVESIVDLACPTFDELAGRAKDCAAGACLIAALASVVVGLIIFMPKLLNVLVP